jgi:hypothetical protein
MIFKIWKRFGGHSNFSLNKTLLGYELISTVLLPTTMMGREGSQGFLVNITIFGI